MKIENKMFVRRKLKNLDSGVVFFKEGDSTVFYMKISPLRGDSLETQFYTNLETGKIYESIDSLMEVIPVQTKMIIEKNI